MNTILAALVNGMLVSAPVCLVIWIALRLTPRNLLNSATRYAIWWTMLAVTVALPFSYLRNDAPDAPARGVQVFPAAATSEQTQGDATVQTFADSSTALQPSRPPLFQLAFPIRISAGPWPSRIIIAWMLAAALMLLRLVVSAVMLERRKARASDLRYLSGCIRGFRVASSTKVSVPLVAGPWRRTILIPAGLLHELSEGEIEQIVIHEAAHLVRRDDYALPVQRALQALFVLHPVVLWVCNRIDLEREIACDDFVIGATGDSVSYASCLARVVQLSGGVRALPMAAAAAEDKSHLATRVDMLLDGTRHTGIRLLRLHLMGAVACIAALGWGAEQTPDVLVFTPPIAVPRVAPNVVQIAPPPVSLPPRLTAQATSVVKPPAPTPPPPAAIPAFEVASIRVREGAPQWKFAISGTRLTIESYTLFALVKEAWNLRSDQIDLTGSDPLLRADDVIYDVTAKAGDRSAPTRDDFRRMLQSLLADRFHMKVHREMKETPVYALVTAKNGPKLKESAPDADATRRFTGSGNTWQLTLPKGSMANLVQGLTNTAFLDRPIVDKTELNGTFDIKLTFTPENRIKRGGETDLTEISIFTAVQEQLGLKLEPQKAMVEMLVVDHVEKPSPN